MKDIMSEIQSSGEFHLELGREGSWQILPSRNIALLQQSRDRPRVHLELTLRPQSPIARSVLYLGRDATPRRKASAIAPSHHNSQTLPYRLGGHATWRLQKIQCEARCPPSVDHLRSVTRSRRPDRQSDHFPARPHDVPLSRKTCLYSIRQRLRANWGPTVAP